ncbi:hypothetical protein SRB5_14860 [Streptomyces sp. RB5]|uniref:Uncharacterized protein n=1 Tax=Streptomyces smaragdinus TaxID=2585196 RepID=A0A7K0CD32_9ACTN|nr:hypothetical protein [Streptomyces smaragdinus]MQY11370.1 hypothetical protein [Streptomyces smaragdinus]
MDDIPGPLRFQLVLLRRMADHNPALVEDALRELGVGKDVMREANRAWQGRLRAGRRQLPAGVKDYGALLGAPEAREDRPFGDVRAEAYRWPVPLWPDLRFEAVVLPGGTAVNAWLVRAADAKGPGPRTLEDLTPWSATVDEVAHAFPPATPREGDTDNRFRLAFEAPDRDGEPHGVTAEFAWGLLQRLETR